MRRIFPFLGDFSNAQNNTTHTLVTCRTRLDALDVGARMLKVHYPRETYQTNLVLALLTVGQMKKNDPFSEANE
jgi:hypothetical protein